MLQLGQRKTEADINTYRNIAGVRLIQLPQNWYVDASFLYAESDAEQTNFNDTLNSRLNASSFRNASWFCRHILQSVH